MQEVHVDKLHNTHKDRTDNAEPRENHEVGTEVLSCNDGAGLRRSGETERSPGKCTGSDRTGDDDASDVCFLEELKCYGVYDENDDEQGYTAVSQKCADEEYAGYCKFGAELVGNAAGYGRCHAGVLHGTGEHRTGHEYQEVVLGKCSKCGHEAFRQSVNDIESAYQAEEHGYDRCNEQYVDAEEYQHNKQDYRNK